MSIELEPNSYYITKGGYVVYIIRHNKHLHATQETSPGETINGASAELAWKTEGPNIGWKYRENGEIKGLISEWNEKLRIVEKAPFSSLPELPKGYRFKDGFARLSPAKDGELFLSYKGHSVLKLDNNNNFTDDPILGRRRFILEKEPAHYTELKIGDVLREGDQCLRHGESSWKNCTIRKEEKDNTIRSTCLKCYSYRRPVQNIVLSRPDTKTTEKLRNILGENVKDIVCGPELQNIASENSNSLTYIVPEGRGLRRENVSGLKNKPYKIEFGPVLDFTLENNQMTSTTTFEHNGVTYYYLGKDEVLKEGDILSRDGEWNPCHETIGCRAHLAGYKYARPVGAFRPIINTAGDTVSSSLTTRKENVMTELMNKTTPLAKSALSLCWRVVKHQANYWIVETITDSAKWIGRKVRYVALFSAIGAGTYAYNYPQEAKDLAMKCLPKIQVSFEKPEILN